ncbi:MAG: hypothetical protein ACREVB_07465 [Burkholderiales bacterium]
MVGDEDEPGVVLRFWLDSPEVPPAPDEPLELPLLAPVPPAPD